jgi:hypothetical protein
MPINVIQKSEKIKSGDTLIVLTKTAPACTITALIEKISPKDILCVSGFDFPFEHD